MHGDELPILKGGSARARRLGTSLPNLVLLQVALSCILVAAAAPADADEFRTDVKVAIIGDQGLGEVPEAVLQLIANEGAAAVLHAGDFDYQDDPDAWEAQIDAFLGPDFPYFAVIGNHDAGRFYDNGGYQDLLEARMDRLGIPWQGDLGVQSSFEWEGIFFVLTAPDVVGEGDGFHDLYIRDQLAASDALWRISSWHKNMRLMQAGTKNDATGWGVYEESRRGGALIATGHSHTYSRSHLLSSTEFQEVADSSDDFVMSVDDPGTPEDEGRTVVVVSGLGGRSAREQHVDGPWWAKIYTRDQNAVHGALFGVFYEGGTQNRARFYFKNLLGEVIDEFWVTSAVNVGVEPTLVAEHVSVLEGDSDSRDAELRVALLAPAGTEVSVDYATRDQEATAGSDYAASAGRLVFPAGELEQTVRVPVHGDTDAEGEESFFVDLSNPVNAVLLAPIGRVTIVDDDGSSGEGPREGTRLEQRDRPRPLTRRAELQELQAGASSGSRSVSTTHPLTAAEGDLYVAAIASKSHVWVSEVTGLGLEWSPLHEQCAGRGQTGVAVWQALGTPDDDERVTASFVSAPSNAVISVARYSGRGDLEAVYAGAANTTGQAGACTGGSDTASFEVEVDGVSSDAQLLVAVAMRTQDHLAGPGFFERTEIYGGATGGNQVGLSLVESSALGALPEPVTGGFDGPVDWAVVAVEIHDAVSFDLTLQAVDGSLTVDPPGDSYPEGSSVELTATPDAGFVFTGWAGDLPAGEENPATLVMDFHKWVIADFAPGFEVTVAPSMGGSVSLSPPAQGLYASGTQVTLEADPDPGFVFGGWQGDAPAGAGSVASLLVDADKQVGALFFRVVDLQLAPTSGGTIAVDPPQGPYLSASTVTLHATPAVGFAFDGWTGDVPAGEGNPASLLMDSDKVVGASFAAILVHLEVGVVPSFGGTVALDPPGGTYPFGTTVTLSAVPQPGFAFAGWQGSVPAGAGSVTSLVLEGDETVEASFSTVFELAVTPPSGGSLAVDPPEGPYLEGSTVELTATPAPGFVFDGWTGDVPPGQGNPALVQMDAEKVVGARFIAAVPELQEIATGGSSGSSSVATGAAVEAAEGDLYLAVVSAKPHTEVVGVSGLGLAWSLVRSQCGGRGQTGLSLWQASGQAGGAGAVTATLASAPRNAVIAVSRYAGAPSLGGVVSANTLGVSGACSGGSDQDNYAVELDTTTANATVYVAVALRRLDHVPGPGFVETAEIHHGTLNSDKAGLATAESFVAEPGPVNVSGTVSSTVDWALITMELRGSAAP